MEEVLVINDLCKKAGNKEILKGLNLVLDKGKVLGILGPNGKGKTTLLNIISGLIRATSGEVLVDGIKVSCETKKIISYLLNRIRKLNTLPFNIKQACRKVTYIFEMHISLLMKIVRLTIYHLG